MIQVENLTKRYAGFTAVNGLNFRGRKGRNRWLPGPERRRQKHDHAHPDGYLPATSGRASIAGFDVFEQSLEARRRLGYLPENTPLYHDMRVNEYLAYRAHLKGVPAAR
jgi:ABC-2 type transport system ATP-binding protein